MEKNRTSNRILPVLPTLANLDEKRKENCKIEKNPDIEMQLIIHVKVGNTDKTLGFCGKMKRCRAKNNTGSHHLPAHKVQLWNGEKSGKNKYFSISSRKCLH